MNNLVKVDRHKSPVGTNREEIMINEEVKAPVCDSDNISKSVLYKTLTNKITHSISPSKKKRVVKRKKIDLSTNDQDSPGENILNQSLFENSVPKLLSQRKLNSSAFKRNQRNNLENSLVYSALVDVQESNRIKAEYREPDTQPHIIGKLFYSYEIDKIVRSMYSSVPKIEEVDEKFEA